MIHAFYWPRELRLVMVGHADSAHAKYPLICAGASALFYALCTTTDGFQRARWCKSHYHLEEKGIGFCRVWPKKRYFKRLRVAMGMCVAGLLMMAEQYENVVKVHVMSDEHFPDDAVIEESAHGGVSLLQKFVYDNTKSRPLQGQESPTLRAGEPT